MAEARNRYTLPDAPAMPCVELGLNAKVSGGRPQAKKQREAPGKGHFGERPHQERIAPKGRCTINEYGLIHQLIPMKTAMTIPKARAAVDAEWDINRMERKPKTLLGILAK